tara:strand:+ start:16708 stop:17466 length:759 start_codon:yes stop_codon:yes gene_type:complete
MKKKLGQNFLRNIEISESIVELSKFEKDIDIMEIGPGDGALTDFLVEKYKNITLLEFDSDLITPLSNRYKKYNVKIIHEDARTYKVRSNSKINIIGNLPYYASNIIIRNFMSQENVNSMVFTVQKEVGEQIVAGTGKKSFLSLLIQSFSDVEKLLIIKNHEFYPIPKVDSMTVKITPKNVKIDNDYVEFLKKGFSNPRKKISNSLSMGLKLSLLNVKKLLEESKVKDDLRPQHLELENWENIYKNYKKYEQI